MINKKKNNKGFTLVELLVVIAIIGILAVVAVPALFSNINKAKIADLEADYSAYKSATLSYYADNNGFTTQSTTGGVITGTNAVTTANGLSAYMESIPVKSPFGDDYKITSGAGNTLYLETTTKKALKDKEIEKLTKDLGDSVKINPNASGTTPTTTHIQMTLVNNK